MSGGTWSREGQGRIGQGAASPGPSPVTSSLASLAAQGSAKSGHHLSLLAVAVMPAAPAQLPIQVIGSHTPPFPSSQGDSLSAFVLKCCSLDPGCVPDTGPVA